MVLNRDIPAFEIATFIQTALKCIHYVRRRVAAAYEANRWHYGLLRACA